MSFVNNYTCQIIGLYILLQSICPNLVNAQEPVEEQWSIHGQLTGIVQQKTNFYSPYADQNSLLNHSQGNGAKSYTSSATLFLGTRLWKGAEIYYNPEMFGGVPFDGQLSGLGGFYNGELQKGAYSPPIYFNGRSFIRQTVGLGGESEYLESAANQLAGTVDKNRLVFSYGKFSSLDFFDQNSYSHDGRTQFMNFSIFSMGAFGYAADTKGFTYGGVVEWYQNNWIARAARLALPNVPNLPALDYGLTQNYANQFELTREHEIMAQPGAIRVLYYQQQAFMGSFRSASILGQQTRTTPELINVRQAGQNTWGYGINFEQALRDDIGIFGRWSWNPGTTETQTLDISSSLSGGISIKGNRWSRPNDTLGIGFAMNGISAEQIGYLQQRGMTAFIGDGDLSYQKEQIFETYYSAKVFKELYISADYQRIQNPAYNAARGPIHIFGLRAHIEM